MPSEAESGGKGILRADGAVERLRAGPAGAWALDAPSPLGLRSAPNAFPGLRHPDRFRAQAPELPGGFRRSPPLWRRRQGLQAGPWGREVAH